MQNIGLQQTSWLPSQCKHSRDMKPGGHQAAIKQSCETRARVQQGMLWRNDAV
jgi:hypothetical protein